MDKIDYQIINKHCEDALMELNATSNIESWVHKYKDLFESISIQPAGLPSIANQHYDGVKYFFIGELHKVYNQKVRP